MPKFENDRSPDTEEPISQGEKLWTYKLDIDKFNCYEFDIFLSSFSLVLICNRHNWDLRPAITTHYLTRLSLDIFNEYHGQAQNVRYVARNELTLIEKKGIVCQTNLATTAPLCLLFVKDVIIDGIILVASGIKKPRYLWYVSVVYSTLSLKCIRQPFCVSCKSPTSESG